MRAVPLDTVERKPEQFDGDASNLSVFDFDRSTAATTAAALFFFSRPPPPLSLPLPCFDAVFLLGQA